MKKRFFSLILAGALVLSLAPMTAFAADVTTDTSGAETTVTFTVDNSGGGGGGTDDPVNTSDWCVTIPASLNLNDQTELSGFSASRMNVGSRFVRVYLDCARSLSDSYLYLDSPASDTSLPCRVSVGGSRVSSTSGEQMIVEWTRDSTAPFNSSSLSVTPESSVVSTIASGTYSGRLYFNIRCEE